jgi:hypothetical protein
MKTFKLAKFLFSILAIGCTSIFSNVNAQQNVSISDVSATPDASSVLDISSTSKGLLIPRVALTATNLASPITLPATSMMVYNTATAGVSPNNVIPGYYYNSGTPTVPNWTRLANGPTNGTEWKLLGNSGTDANTNFLGTIDAVDLVFRTNNTEKVRIMSGGNVGIGTATPYAKLNVAGNGTALSGNGIIIGTIGASLNTNVAIGAETGRFELAFAGYRDVEPNQIGAKIVSIRRNNFQANSALIQSSDLAFFTGSGSTGGSTSNFQDITSERMRIEGTTGNVGVGTSTPAVRLAVNGAGTDVYATDAWIENNMHVQGNETLTQGGRGRMRVGTAWNYMGLYTDASSTGTASDLVLGASSGLVRIGCNGCGQNFKVSGLEGTNTQPVYATSNGVLTRTPPAGQVLNVVMVNGGNLGTNVTVNSTTWTTVITTTYTPVSNNSFLIIECSIDYQIGGTSSDQWRSQITVDGTQAGMCYQYWNNGNGGGTRGSVLFPLMGRYENSSTSTKTINAQAARVLSDDNGTFYRYLASTWIKITEVQK